MKTTIGKLFHRDPERYEGVRRLNIYLLRLLYGLIAVFVGHGAWTHILTHRHTMEPMDAVTWCVWASYSVLSLAGLLHPLRMLPIVLLEIVYKMLWLALVAYPLWSSGELAGSGAQGIAETFLWVLLPIIAVPWRYTIRTYMRFTKTPGKLLNPI